MRIGTILHLSGVVAVVANLVHPNKIPWVQEWSARVEGQAKAKNIRMIPFSVALEKFHDEESVFIDARPSGEYEHGHVPGAVSIPFDGMDEWFEQIGALIDSGRELIVYCLSLIHI